MYVKRVSPLEAHEMIRDDGWVYVDVRSVQGSSANADFLSVMERHFPRDARLVVGCRTANRSEHAIVMLMRAGYTNVAIQRAGFLGTRDFFGRSDPGWGKQDLPTSKQAEPGRSWAELNGGKRE
jgi:rhodanese-related sulfurtransferase